MKPSYSKLFIIKEIHTDFISEIKENLKSGIKIIIITNKNIQDLIKTDSFLTTANNEGFLQITQENNLKYENNKEFIDGVLDNEIIEALKESNFNINQFLIEHNNIQNHIIVKAGAGSGKTKTMIDRILFLKHQDETISFSEVAMITFTNEATNQMKLRLSNRISAYYNMTQNPKYLQWLQELNNITIDTIHRFAKKIISFKPEALGLTSEFQISNFRYRKKKMLEQLIDKYNNEYPENYQTVKYIPQYLVINSILRILDYFDNRAIDISDNINIDFGEEEFSHMINYLLRNTAQQLNKIKIDEDKLETTDLIKKLRVITEEDSNSFNLKYKYVFVDEFQDTDFVQAEFLLWLMKKSNTKIFIVGDTKQSIYRFRGADYTAFEGFISNIKEEGYHINEFDLNINYRTNKELIEKYNTLFSKLDDYVENFTFRDNDKLKSFIVSTQEESLIIEDMSKDNGLLHAVNKILTMKNNREKDTGKKTTVAILTRSNRQVKEVSEYLNKNNIYCNVEIEGDFFRHRAVIEFYTLIKALIYKNTPENLYGLISSSYGINSSNNYEILRGYNSEKSALKTFIDNNTEIKELIIQYNEIIESKPILVAIEEIIKISKPHLNYGKRKFKDLNNKKDLEKLRNIKKDIYDYQINLDHLQYLINKSFQDKYVTIYDIENYLRINISTNNEESRKKTESGISEDSINCMTVHKSKGLEFDIVIMPYTNSSFLYNSSDVDVIIHEVARNKYKVGYNIEIYNKNYKNQLYSYLKAREESEIIGEETRLLYVGTTRAKEMLLMHSPTLVSTVSKPRSWTNLIGQGWK